MSGEKLWMYGPSTGKRVCPVNEENHQPCPLCKWQQGSDNKIVYTPGPDREVTLLRVANLIETRAMLRAKADMDLRLFDIWYSDYASESLGISVEIDRLLDTLK